MKLLTLAGGAGDAAEISSNVWRDLLKEEVEASAGAVLPPSGCYSGDRNRHDWNWSDVGMV
jgi:hypothetical protein